MVETHRNGNDLEYWGYLIKPDSSAAPHLEQLCLGLARIICKLDSGPTDRLTPRRMAAFYKSVGGDLDAMFLKTSESGLSFLYRTIGCYHSLEPGPNPFETPSMPCLTPEGFVKWSTVQLLLCPGEHTEYLQNAVRVYDVPRPEGGVFPKSIPKEAFPSKPDAAMEAWHRQVSGQLKQENYVRQRIKNSPYHSPRIAEPAENYFGQTVPKIRRPSRPGRQHSGDGEQGYHYSRRSSEPEWASPTSPGDHNQNLYVRNDGTRSVSANRPSPASPISRQRSATTNNTLKPTRPPNPSSRNSEHPPVSFDRWQQSVERGRRHSGRSRSPSSASTTSADDASSEDSRKRSGSKRKKAASSLLSVLPFTTPWHKRSRSHDVSDRKDKGSPRRDEYDNTPPMRASTETFHRSSPSVRFRQDMFDNQAANSAPESRNGRRSQSGTRPEHRYPRNPTGPGLTDPASPANYNFSKETSSGSGSDHRSAYEIPARQLRKVGTPQRGPPDTGVHGRKYASVEQTRDGPLPPSAVSGGPVQQDPRNQVRYSLAV